MIVILDLYNKVFQLAIYFKKLCSDLEYRLSKIKSPIPFSSWKKLFLNSNYISKSKTTQNFFPYNLI